MEQEKNVFEMSEFEKKRLIKNRNWSEIEAAVLKRAERHQTFERLMKPRKKPKAPQIYTKRAEK